METCHCCDRSDGDEPDRGHRRDGRAGSSKQTQVDPPIELLLVVDHGGLQLVGLGVLGEFEDHALASPTAPRGVGGDGPDAVLAHPTIYESIGHGSGARKGQPLSGLGVAPALTHIANDRDVEGGSLEQLLSDLFYVTLPLLGKVAAPTPEGDGLGVQVAAHHEVVPLTGTQSRELDVATDGILTAGMEPFVLELTQSGVVVELVRSTFGRMLLELACAHEDTGDLVDHGVHALQALGLVARDQAEVGVVLEGVAPDDGVDHALGLLLGELVASAAPMIHDQLHHATLLTLEGVQGLQVGADHGLGHARLGYEQAATHDQHVHDDTGSVCGRVDQVRAVDLECLGELGLPESVRARKAAISLLHHCEYVLGAVSLDEPLAAHVGEHAGLEVTSEGLGRRVAGSDQTGVLVVQRGSVGHSVLEGHVPVSAAGLVEHEHDRAWELAQLVACDEVCVDGHDCDVAVAISQVLSATFVVSLIVDELDTDLVVVPQILEHPCTHQRGVAHEGVVAERVALGVLA